MKRVEGDNFFFHVSIFLSVSYKRREQYYNNDRGGGGGSAVLGDVRGVYPIRGAPPPQLSLPSAAHKKYYYYKSRELS